MHHDPLRIEVGNKDALSKHMGNDLYVDVKAYGGSHIHQVIRQMVALATRINVDVWCDLNGVRTLARPFDDWEKLIVAWEAELDSKRAYKHAST